MASVKAISTFMVLTAVFIFMWFLGVTIFDPLESFALNYNTGGMGGQISDIHVAIVKYMFPVAIFTFLGFAVFRILSQERQTRPR